MKLHFKSTETKWGVGLIVIGIIAILFTEYMVDSTGHGSLDVAGGTWQIVGMCIMFGVCLMGYGLLWGEEDATS